VLRHLGYMAATQTIDASTSRTCRPRDATADRVRSLTHANLRDLARIFRFQAEQGIHLYRIGSQVIPFAADPGNPVAWWDDFAAELETIGQFARRHVLRLTMHPGHHTLLNAPSPETMALSILELGWHVRFLDALQVDATNKLVLRIGGTFGDKAGALDRFVAVVNGLPAEWRRRLVVENDETQFTVRDTLEAATQAGIPAVFDRAHHRANPGDDPDLACLIGRCFETWTPADGAPIVHLSSPTVGEGRRPLHADWIEPGDLEALVVLAPADVPFDCLLEAAQGDRALFDLRERMATREGNEVLGRVAATPIRMR